MPRKPKVPRIFAGRMHDVHSPFGGIISVCCEGPDCEICVQEGLLRAERLTGATATDIAYEHGYFDGHGDGTRRAERAASMIEEHLTDEERRRLVDLVIKAIPAAHGDPLLTGLVAKLSGTDTVIVAHRAYPSAR